MSRPRWSYDLLIITDLSGPRGLAPYLEALTSAVHGRVALQLRDKDLSDEALLTQGRVLLAHARDAGVPLLVNERIDLARALGAEGLHLPERAPFVRVDDGWVGASVHDEAGVLRRRDADLLVLGPLGHVDGKNAPLDDESFTQCTARAVQPVLALGGIRTSAHVERALALGAFGIALRHAISHAAQGGEAIETWLRTLDEARARAGLSTKLRA